MRDQLKKTTPKTKHIKIADETDSNLNQYTVLDNPDDRMTEQTGDGTTIVITDNPDDAEDKLPNSQKGMTR